MDEVIQSPAGEKLRQTPVHLWIVGALSLAWNAFGATDYIMTETHNAAYLATATPAQMAWFASFPAWEVACWAVGVWGAVAGSLLLLARSRHAVTAFAVSLAGLALSSIYQGLINPGPAEGHATGMPVITGLIWAVAIALLVYASAMRRLGVLR